MAYNPYNPYLYNYNNTYYQPQPVQQQQNNNPTNDLIWVQGEAGAKAYLVAPNATVTLWDSESPTIYLKTSDARGVPSMRILDFKERNTTPQNAVFSTSSDKNSIAVLSSEVHDLRTKYDEICERLSDMEHKSTKKKQETE